MTAAELGEAKQAPEFGQGLRLATVMTGGVLRGDDHRCLVAAMPADQVAYYHCWTPCPVPLAVLVRVAGLSGWPEPLHVIPMAKEPYR
jgi:hypothetical protein